MRSVRRVVPAPAGLGTVVIGVPEGTDLELNLRLEAVMEGVLVTGSVRGPAVGECVRCLADARVDLDVDVMDLYVYPGHTVPDEDDDVRELQDDLIDLQPAIRDAVVTSLPFQPVCREDCLGLCPDCGVRLADEPDHRHESVDPRWAALQGMLSDAASDRVPDVASRPDATQNEKES